jgi:tripartite-type tricarboxylate transporter receptor subunit TctC
MSSLVKKILVLNAIALTCSFFYSTIYAQGNFPSRPIDIITHASPGGGTDATARTMAMGIQLATGIETAVFPRTGGGGVVAMNYFDRQEHDGHTLLAITPTHLFAMARGQSTIQITDLIGIARATEDPLIVMVHSDSPINSLIELIEYGRLTPIKWGTTQVGGVDHVAGAILAKRANTQLNVVPFSGGGEIVTNLIGGTIDAAALNLTEALDQIERGVFKPLAVLSDKRIGLLEETPTALELGYDVIFATIRGYLVHRDTPPEQIIELESILTAGLNHPIYKDYLTGSGMDASSIAIGQEWNNQVSILYANAYEAMLELGIIENPSILSQYMSPYFFPNLLITGISILLLFLFFSKESFGQIKNKFNRKTWMTLLILLLSGVAFERIGAIPTMMLCLFFLQSLWGQRKKIYLIGVSLGIPIIIFILFSTILNIRFPAPLWN